MSDNCIGPSAFPIVTANDVYSTGISKREYFAAKALQGILANTDHNGKYSEYAKDAVKHADALLAELSKTEGSK